MATDTDTRVPLRLRGALLVALMLLTLGAAACGDDDPVPAPGSPENPLAATSSGGSESSNVTPKPSDPGFRDLVENQERKPRDRFSPCSLVTKAQAGAFLRTSVADPVEAPQGPTCIFRATRGPKAVTLTMERQDFAQLRRRMDPRRRVDVGDRTAYCGKIGRTLLVVDLRDGRVLNVGAGCAVATRFAKAAVGRL